MDERYVCVCTRVDYNRGEVTYTVAKLEDIVHFELGQEISIPVAGDRKLAALFEQKAELDAKIAEHARAMQAARKPAPEYPAWGDKDAIEDYLLDHVALPVGVKLEVERSSLEDAYNVRLSTDEPHYGVVFMTTEAYLAKISESDYWNWRLTEVRGLVSVLEARMRPGVMIKADPVGVPGRNRICYTRAVCDGVHMAPSERTCTTCSKTCDVGSACWWCGNS